MPQVPRSGGQRRVGRCRSRRPVKPGEIDSKVVLERGWPELDAWADLFNLSDKQEEEVLGRLNQQGRGEDATLFRLLGGMRYRTEEAELGCPA